MFTRAGFNARRRRICCALVSMGGSMYWVWLVRFRPSGDMAWETPYGFKWSLYWTFDHIEAPYVSRSEQSRLPR